LRWTQDGSVGIGTDDPHEKLDIVGNLRLRNGDIYLKLSGSIYHGLGWYGTTSENYGKGLFAGKDINGPVLYGYNGGALGSRQSGTETIALQWFPNGNVGIGTTNPTKNLHVAGNACFGQTPEINAHPSAKVKIYGDGSATDNFNWSVTHSLVLQGSSTIAMCLGVDPILNLAYISASTIVPDAGANLILSPHGGNVGIGTTCPSEKLAVNGKIRVKDEIIIDNATGWCDYVYSPEYKFLTIPELEKYLLKYKHMPGVKSASEMEKSGFTVLETNKQMMEKIEELSLYIIQLEKRISELEKK